MITLTKNKEIRLNAPTSLSEVHIFLQNEADNTAYSAADDLLVITDANPSYKITNDIFILYDDWHIPESDLKWIYGGAFKQFNDTYDRLKILGVKKVKNPKITTNGSIFKSWQEDEYLVKNATKAATMTYEGTEYFTTSINLFNHPSTYTLVAPEFKLNKILSLL